MESDGSDLVQLLSLDKWVGLGNGFPPHGLVIKGAAMLLRVPVGPAVDDPTPTFKPGQPDTLPALIFVAFGTQVQRGAAAEESTVVGAETMASCLLTFLFLGHYSLR
nr:hypothetical protein MA16_Dca010771 [Ipomoea batatas]